MSADPGARQVAGFAVHHLPEVERMVYVRPAGSGPAVDLDVDLADRVSCTIRLLPVVAVHAIVVDHAGEAGGFPADVALADRVARTPGAALALDAYATALEAAGSPGAGRVWAVELAVRALEVIELLDLRSADAEAEGVWPVWSTMCATAAQALAEVPDPARFAGDSALRVAVAVLANRLRARADRLATEWLDETVDGWPVSEADRPILGDDTMVELERTSDVKKRVRLGGSARGTAGPGATLTVNLEALVRIGLVDSIEGVVVMPVGIEAQRAWELRIRLREEVAAAFVALSEAWRRWHVDPERRPGTLPPEVRLELGCAFAAVLAETHLPYTLDDFLRSAKLRELTPPHLADVVCLVSAEGVSGPVGFIEEQDADRRVDLVAVIPHRDRPTADTVSVTLRPGRTPMVSARRRTTADRLLALRRELAEGATPLDRTIRKLKKELADEQLNAALDAEVAAAPKRLSPEVRTIVEAVRRSQDALVPALRAAAAQRDLGAVERLAAHLSRTRAYLSGVTG